MAKALPEGRKPSGATSRPARTSSTASGQERIAAPRPASAAGGMVIGLRW